METQCTSTKVSEGKGSGLTSFSLGGRLRGVRFMSGTELEVKGTQALGRI